MIVSRKKWVQFALNYDIDPEIGVLIKPDYIVTSFDFQTLKQLVKAMKELENEQELDKFFSVFPDLHVKESISSLELVILHGFLVFVVEKFMDHCRKSRREVSGALLPKNIAVPLYMASKQLEMSPGMCYGQQYNWVPKKEPMDYTTQQFGYQDFEMKTTLSRNTLMEKMFFGGSLIASFYIGKMVRFIWEMNEVIENAPLQEQQVLQRLQKCKIYWQKILDQNNIIINEFDYEYFKDELKLMVDGFKGLVFEGVDNGQNKALDAGRGSGGADPSFQIFENGFGLTFNGPIVQGQTRLRTMMPKKNVELMKYFSQHSHIRQYCDCTLRLTKAYNEVLALYSEFLFLHQSFIRKFFLSQKQIPKTSQEKVDVEKEPVNYEMKGFLSHYEQVKAQMLKTEGKK